MNQPADLSPAERSAATHRQLWGEPEFAVRAPGRVNLIGEHTDYNDGFCLPMALPFETVVAVSRTNDGDLVQIHSDGFGEATIDVSDRSRAVADWAGQIAGVLWLLNEQGVESGGWNGAVAADIPAGAGLSSSAAIEVAVINVVLQLHGLTWSALQIAKLGQRAESEVLGLPTGIMDQFISAGATEGSASFMDCRDLTLSPAPVPRDIRVAVLDTGTRRRLVDGEYGQRRANCEAAAEYLGVEALRDATAAAVDSLPDSMVLERRRARHIVRENERTVSAAEAMAAGDSVALGELMNASHASLRDDFSVSSPALDQVVAIAQTAPGCLGARMTGGGFAGCAVAIVDITMLDQFKAAVEDGYTFVDEVTGERHTATVWFCTPEAGSGLHAIGDTFATS